MQWIQCCLLLLMVCVQTPERQRAKELNDKAIEIYYTNLTDKSRLQKALQLLDEAIKLDSLYDVAYWNKVTLLCNAGEGEVALKVLDQLLVIAPDFIGTLSMQGHILERMGRPAEAQAKYRHELDQCEKAIKKGLDSLKVPLRISRAFLLMFVKGVAVGVREFEKIAAQYPEDKYVIMQRETFEGFDRKKFIEDFCN